jgi:hypothetical protein
MIRAIIVSNKRRENMKKTFLAYSGGKDSTAMALLNPDAIPVFTDTGWEFDEIYEQIDKFERVTGREIIRLVPDETLPEYIRRSKFMPGHRARFCTRIFKIEQYNKWLEKQLEDSQVELAIGIRADEPKRIGNQSEIEGVTIRYPLQDQGYGIWDVIRTCTEYNLLPRYPAYMAAGGCKGCYYKGKAEVKAMAQLCPHVLDELQPIEEEVQDERGRFAYMFPNTGMSIADIRRQPALFDMTDLYRDASDRSQYGRNCGDLCRR